MGALDFLRGAIEPAAAARAGWLQGEHAADEENKKDALLAAAQKRQGILDQIKATLDASTTRRNNAQANKATEGDTNVVPVMNPDGTTTYSRRAEAVGQRAPTTNKDIQLRNRIQELVDGGMSAETANSQARAEFGAAPPSQYTFGTAEDDQGNPVIVRRDTKTGTVAPTGMKAVPPAAGGARQQAQVQTAQNLVASSDKIMNAFEDQLLSGERSIGAPAAALAKVALSGGPIQSTAAETALNKIDPDLAGYVRASKAVSTAERMIAPRGGSNYMTQAEAMLSAAGPSANENLIKQAREYRHGLVGGLQTGAKPAAAPAAPAPGATPSATPAPTSPKGGSSIPSRYGIKPARASEESHYTAQQLSTAQANLKAVLESDAPAEAKARARQLFASKYGASNTPQ